MGAKEAEESIIGDFLEKLEFKKKAFGGIDEIDVLGRMEELASLYEDRITALNRELTEAKEALAAAQKRAAESDALAAKLASTEAALATARAVPVPTVSAPTPPSLSSLPTTDDFMRTLQEVRQDVLAKAREEASELVNRARESAEAAARVEHDRRLRAVRTAQDAGDKAKSAMRKLAAALNDIETLEAGLTNSIDAPLSERSTTPPLGAVDPWEAAAHVREG